MLRVSVNLKQGVYIISEDDGQKVIEVPIEGKYDKNTIIATRKEIQSNNRHIVAKEKLNSIDAGVYQAIKQFDNQYGTNYAYNYAKAIGEEIFHTHYDISSKDYKQKMAGIRAEELKKADVNIEYNVSLLGGLGKLKFGERIRAIRTAFLQKRNGVNVQFANSKQLLLEAPVAKPVDSKDDIPDMPESETLKKIIKEDEKAKSKEAKGSVVIPEPQVNGGPTPEVPVNLKRVQELANPNQRNIDEMLENIRGQEAENSEINPAPAVAELQEALAGRRVASAGRVSQPPAQKKKISRSKAIQASKQEKRDAGKLKNRYKDMQQAKAERQARAADPEQIRLAAERRAAKEEQKRIAEEQRKAAEAEQKRLDAERRRAEEERKRQEAEQNKKQKRILAFSKIGAKSQEMATRFTRKVKDKADSIRNKKFIPKLTDKQKKIAKATTIVALTATLAIGSGLGVYKLLSNSNRHTADIEGSSSSPAAVETMKTEQDVDKDGIDYVLGIHDNDTKTPTQTPTTQTPSQDEVKPGAPVQEEENQSGVKEEDSKKEYLSSIKVGAAMSINSGRYFETPEGQGNYGYFENYTNGVKKIQFIDVMTNEGYIVIKDDSVNLWELKQQYPDAKFSYHIVYENEDGTTRPLGWLTESSMDQNMDQQQNMIDIDDMDM